jgi:hypothetical protein
MTSWLILRTAGSKTLKLAETLRADGYEAWSPVETRSIRIPRANVRRKVTLPIMPSYVFARDYHLIDLLELSALAVRPNGVPSFSVLHIHNKIPLIADEHLDELRAIQAKRTPRKIASEALPKGARVGVEGGSFSGMRGVVERSDTVHTLVSFGGNYSVKISTGLFEKNELGELLALMGEAARKAA